MKLAFYGPHCTENNGEFFGSMTYGFPDSELEYVKYKDYQAFASEYDQSHY